MRERVNVKSPVREYCTPGSVRGAPGNRCPYLDKQTTKPQMLETGLNDFAQPGFFMGQRVLRTGSRRA